ncbi:MAG: C1 family peptidase [Bacteroidales bacterium]|nr:C1 family peptidase [Bacteroidales bacterium]
MNKIKFITFLLLISCFSTISFAQTTGTISTEMLKQIKQSYKKTSHSQALTNAISNNNLNSLALNRENINQVDHYFKYKVKVKGITDQKSSGRCWMFSGLNVLRPKVIEKYNLNNFEFSKSHLFFWDQLEKANLFLEIIIKTANKPIDDRTVQWAFKYPINDGGVWNSLANLLEKYGAVPKSAMSETHSSNNTRYMGKILNTKLREQGLELREMIANKTKANKVEIRKVEMLGDIYKILAYNMGEPPTEFTWRYTNAKDSTSEEKTYTPKSFLKEVLDVNLNDYVLLMDDPSRPYNKLYEIQYDRNVQEGKNWVYINIPASEIKKFALESIKNNEAMYFSCDVGKQLNKDAGLLSIDNYDYSSLYNIDFGMNKKERILSRQSGSSHGMVLVGVDVDKSENPTKWLIENSWGIKAAHNGYLTATDKWFDEYMFRVVVDKKFVDAKTLKILKQEPTLLPPWDPMFTPDN